MSKGICYGWIAMLDYYSWLEGNFRTLSKHNNFLSYGGIYCQKSKDEAFSHMLWVDANKHPQIQENEFTNKYSSTDFNTKSDFCEVRSAPFV